jgi:hypothetical protein
MLTNLFIEAVSLKITSPHHSALIRKLYSKLNILFVGNKLLRGSQTKLFTINIHMLSMYYSMCKPQIHLWLCQKHTTINKRISTQARKMCCRPFSSNTTNCPHDTCWQNLTKIFKFEGIGHFKAHNVRVF